MLSTHQPSKPQSLECISRMQRKPPNTLYFEEVRNTMIRRVGSACAATTAPKEAPAGAGRQFGLQGLTSAEGFGFWVI